MSSRLHVLARPSTLSLGGSKQFPALTFGWVIITTLYHFMLQSWYQNNVQPLMNMISFLWLFPFLLEKTWYFRTSIKGEGGYVIQLKFPSYFWPGSQTKELGHEASSPLLPLSVSIIRWFFLFCWKKTRYFPTLIRAEGGYVIQLKRPNYFWPEL